MESCLLEKLRNIDKPIFVNNETDYNFLMKMNEYYNLKLDIYNVNSFLLIDSYYKFNYDDGLTYDKKINKCIFLIESLDEINLKPSEFFYI